MANFFKDKTPPELIEMVRGEEICGECFGKCWNVDGKCPTCNGTGKQPPMSDDDLNGLTAIYCEGWEYLEKHNPDYRWHEIARGEEGLKGYHPEPPAYTSDPRHAMRLQVKYKIDTMRIQDEGSNDVWEATAWRWPKEGYGDNMVDVSAEFSKGDTGDASKKALCCAITAAALIAALMEGE